MRLRVVFCALEAAIHWKFAAITHCRRMHQFCIKMKTSSLVFAYRQNCFFHEARGNPRHVDGLPSKMALSPEIGAGRNLSETHFCRISIMLGVKSWTKAVLGTI